MRNFNTFEIRTRAVTATCMCSLNIEQHSCSADTFITGGAENIALLLSLSSSLFQFIENGITREKFPQSFNRGDVPVHMND